MRLALFVIVKSFVTDTRKLLSIWDSVTGKPPVPLQKNKTGNPDPCRTCVSESRSAGARCSRKYSDCWVCRSPQCCRWWHWLRLHGWCRLISSSSSQHRTAEWLALPHCCPSELQDSSEIHEDTFPGLSNKSMPFPFPFSLTGLQILQFVVAPVKVSRNFPGASFFLVSWKS